MTRLILPIFMALMIVGCNPPAKTDHDGAAQPSATTEVGFDPTCDVESGAHPDGCGGPPEPPPAPEPKEPKEPKDPRGDVLKVETCGFQCVKVTARCHNGHTGTGSAANGNEARDQAFQDCSD